MTFSGVIRFLEGYTLPGAPWWVLGVVGPGHARVHVLGIIGDTSRRGTESILREAFPATVHVEVTARTCFEHDDCRSVPELGAACWERARATSACPPRC